MTFFNFNFSQLKPPQSPHDTSCQLIPTPANSCNSYQLKTTKAISIHQAVFNGNIEAIKQHLDAGAKVDVKDDKFIGTFLHWAAAGGQNEIVKLLIAKGADVSAKTDNGVTPLHSAARGGQKEIVELLIAKGEEVNVKSSSGYTPLHSAASYGQKEIVELLITKGADVSAKTDNGVTPLHFAGGSTVGSMEVAGLLIAKGADVNARDNYGDTPLHKSAYALNYPRVRLLLSNGAFINRVGIRHKSEGTPLDYAYLAKENISNIPNNMYQNPQHKADANKIITLLKKQGGKTSKLLMAKFRAKKNSLFNAIQGRDLKLAKKLIKDGADIEERGGRESGKRSATPLYYAAYNVDPAMTKLLLESGANVNAVDYQGEIPLHTAIYHSFPNVEEDGIEVIKMLIEN